MKYLNEGKIKYLNEFLNLLRGRTFPCSDEQIEELLLLTHNKKLPMAYEEFMRVMGNGAYGFMPGESVYMDELLFLKEWAVELLTENASKKVLTEDDFVFWMSQGCMFCFFKLSEGDNPPIYLYKERGPDSFVKIAHSLTEFLINKLQQNPKTLRSVDEK